MKQLLFLVVAGGFFLPRPASAQTSDAATLQALLTEVRQLRIAVERTSAGLLRLQMTLPQFQGQEQKVSRLTEQLSEVRKQAALLSADQSRLTEAMRQIESPINQEQDLARRKALEEERRHIKGAVEEKARLGQQLQGQEAELTTALRAEQAKLNEFAKRLKALDRNLEAPAGQLR